MLTGDLVLLQTPARAGPRRPAGGRRRRPALELVLHPCAAAGTDALCDPGLSCQASRRHVGALHGSTPQHRSHHRHDHLLPASTRTTAASRSAAPGTPGQRNEPAPTPRASSCCSPTPSISWTASRWSCVRTGSTTSLVAPSSGWEPSRTASCAATRSCPTARYETPSCTRSSSTSGQQCATSSAAEADQAGRNQLPPTVP